MALVDYADRPPPERKPLPSKEEILACEDVERLTAMLDDVELRIEKISVDLEFEVGDADWDSRARSALTYARVCRKKIASRLSKLKAHKHDVMTATQQAAKAKADAARAEAHAAAERAQTERKLSMARQFLLVAKERLPAEMFQALQNEAHARVRAIEAQGKALERAP